MTDHDQWTVVGLRAYSGADVPDEPPPTPPAQPPPPPMAQNPFGQPPGPPPYAGAYPQAYNPMSPPGTQYMPGQYAPALPPSNGVGIAGGVVGIVAAVLLWFPYVGLILGVIAVVLGAVGLSRSNRLYGAGKGMSIAGMVCGGVALILNILFIVAISTAISTVH